MLLRMSPGTGCQMPCHHLCWPEEQGLAACEQDPHQVVFTVAKFRPPGSHLLGACRCPLPGSLGSAPRAY